MDTYYFLVENSNFLTNFTSIRVSNPLAPPISLTQLKFLSKTLRRYGFVQISAVSLPQIDYILFH